MDQAFKRFYFGTLAILLVLSAYPLINGIRIMFLYLVNGVIEIDQYVRYVIPYAAMCFALLVFAALQPVWPKIFKKSTLALSTAVTLLLFVLAEVFFENMKINTNGLTPIKGFHPAPRVDMWQAFSCFISPDAVRAMRRQAQVQQDGFYYVAGDSTYKIHYYLVCFVIILILCGLIYGLGKMVRDKNKAAGIPLALQGASAAILVGLCIFANMTGFFRDTSPVQNLTASILTCLFFIVLGAAAGIYAGSFLLRKSKPLALGLPALLSGAVCVLMYVGEAAMMEGNLYRFGTGWFFTGISGISLAAVDLLVILLAAAVTYGTLNALRRSASPWELLELGKRINDKVDSNS